MGRGGDSRPIAFLFFEAFFSFVNTKEKKAYFPHPFKGTPAARRDCLFRLITLSSPEDRA